MKTDNFVKMNMIIQFCIIILYNSTDHRGIFVVDDVRQHNDQETTFDTVTVHGDNDDALDMTKAETTMKTTAN